jgi:hypothetical protein
MDTALEYSTRVVQEGGRRCKKSTLNDLVHLTPLRIPLMNPPIQCVRGGAKGFRKINTCRKVALQVNFFMTTFCIAF